VGSKWDRNNNVTKRAREGRNVMSSQKRKYTKARFPQHCELGLGQKGDNKVRKELGALSKGKNHCFRAYEGEPRKGGGKHIIQTFPPG